VTERTLLDVRPIISADRRYVTLEVIPQFDTVDRMVNVPWPRPAGYTGADLSFQTPVTSSKRFRAVARVPDRGTVILGGLTTASTLLQEGGVPILMDLPLIKRLFSAKNTNEKRSHNVWLVTTTIILPDELEAKIPAYGG
jgi:type II secretory pathway component GspD/PulD (secretin)